MTRELLKKGKEVDIENKDGSRTCATVVRDHPYIGIVELDFGRWAPRELVREPLS